MVKISWNEGHDAFLTSVESTDSVLKAFFSIKNWDDVHDISKCVATHKSFVSDECGFDFKVIEDKAKVTIYHQSLSTYLDESAFLQYALDLFELLIAGANDNHHTIRYEPWWHAFCEYMFQVREQLK